MPRNCAVVRVEPLVKLSDETVALLREGARTCSDCACILKHLLGDNRLGPAWRADGTPFKVDEEKRHILELKGLALPPDTVAFLKVRAGTCRRSGGSGCLFCARILDAMTKDGMLREWPHDNKDEQVKIPIDGQIAHIMVELGKNPTWEEAK